MAAAVLACRQAAAATAPPEAALGGSAAHAARHGAVPLLLVARHAAPAARSHADQLIPGAARVLLAQRAQEVEERAHGHAAVATLAPPRVAAAAAATFATVSARHLACGVAQLSTVKDPRPAVTLVM